MTKEECNAKIDEMLPDVMAYLEKEVDRLLRCGAIDLKSEPPENYGMAKNILAVALENAANLSVGHLQGSRSRGIRANLRRF